jgi:Transmembrane protein of unknown function (DUF3556)
MSSAPSAQSNQPAPLPYDPMAWETLPFPERARLACQDWALSGYGAPAAAYMFYALKLGLYFGGFFLFCSLTPSLGGITSFGSWWAVPIAFQKAILWSMLYEGLGLGCGSGPLAGHYSPPIGGVLYFAKPGTVKLPPFPGLPVFGKSQRSWFDVALYLLLVASLVRALLAPSIGFSEVLPVAVLLPLLALTDRTLFLVFRGEHYWTTCMVFLLASNWIAGAKAVQLALWFWAGVSKLNHHFPSVVCVMTSNNPFIRSQAVRRRMYRNFPDDLRPSRIARLVATKGILLELGVPLILMFAPGGWSLVLGISLMLLLHGFITSNVPMGVPIEWNFMVVYGGFALFWSHPEISAFAVGSAPLAALLVVMLIGIPLFGNLFPERMSFLMSMRYYAGNWAMSVWLFRGESSQKLNKLIKSAPLVREQLAKTFDQATMNVLLARTMAFRMMHLHGRALPELIPRAVPRLEDYEYVEGEVVAGVALGWNFGDGHLHNEQLLQAIQERCGYEPGELRVVAVESQPLGRSTLGYRILDAATGVVEAGTLDIDELLRRQPWATTAEPEPAPTSAHVVREA